MANTPKIIRKRLQLKRGKEGAPIVDRWLNFVVGEVEDEEVSRLRGAVFHVDTEWDVLELFRDLKRMARTARKEGKEAEFLDALERRNESQPEEVGDDPTFTGFLKEWLDTSVRNSDLTESEVESTEGIALKHLLPFFGKYPVSQIGPRLIDRYVAFKRRQKHQYGVGYAGSSINNQLSVLRRCLEKAIRYGVIEHNPVTPDLWQRIDRTPEDAENWLEPADEKQLVDWLWSHWEDDPQRWLPLLTQLIAGLRFSELRALKRGDLVDVPKPGVWIRRSLARRETGTPKNKRARFQSLPPAVFTAVRDNAPADPEATLFRPPRGEYLANNSLNRWLRKACKAAGVQGISSHGLRHTAGTSYAALGYSQKAIAALLGHRDTKATERYTHAADRLKAEAVENRWAKVIRMRDRQSEA